MDDNAVVSRSASRSEKGLSPPSPEKGSVGPSVSHVSVVEVGREHLSDAVPPHESYESRHRWDPSATWTEDEEKRVLFKTDMMLMSWLCVMVDITRPTCLD